MHIAQNLSSKAANISWYEALTRLMNMVSLSGGTETMPTTALTSLGMPYIRWINQLEYNCSLTV